MSYDYLKDFKRNMSAGEDFVGQYRCDYEAEPGHLFVTSRRFCWQRLGALTPKVNLAIRDASNLNQQSMQGNVLLKLYTKVPKKAEYRFRFKPARGQKHEDVKRIKDEAKEVCTSLFKAAKERTDEEDMLEAALAEDKKKKSYKKVVDGEMEEKKKKSEALKMKKAAFLEGNPLLKKLFINSVKKKQLISEKSFWETFAKELGRSSTPASAHKTQTVGISSGILGNISKTQSSDGQNNKIELSTDVVRGIFKLYPEIEEYYNKYVVTRQKPESLFWKEVWFSSVFQRGASSKGFRQNENQFLNSDNDQDRSVLARELEERLMNPLNDIAATEVLHDAELSTGHKTMLELKSTKQSHIKKRRRHIAMLNDESAKILDVMAPHSSHHQDEQSEQIEKKMKQGSDDYGDLMEVENDAIPLQSIEEVYKKALDKPSTSLCSTGDSIEEKQPRTCKTLSLPPSEYRVKSIPVNPRVCESTLDHITSLCQPRDAETCKQLSKEDLQVVVQYEEVLGALLREYWRTCGKASSPFVTLSEREMKKGRKLVKTIGKHQKAMMNLLQSATTEQQLAMHTLRNRVDRVIIHFEQAH
eukprot:m.201905 g.201905  ORF g.201905 m.201905 type:complete len:585 (+) comp13718_c1_seq21:143-1897(+)